MKSSALPPVLTITSTAAAAILQVMQSESVPEGFALRVGIRGAGIGCAGHTYVLGFDSKKENDLEYEVDGIPVLIDKGHSMYVLGMEIDWHEDEQQKGFVFNNPQKRKESEPEEEKN